MGYNIQTAAAVIIASRVMKIKISNITQSFAYVVCTLASHIMSIGAGKRSDDKVDNVERLFFKFSLLLISINIYLKIVKTNILTEYTFYDLNKFKFKIFFI